MTKKTNTKATKVLNPHRLKKGYYISQYQNDEINVTYCTGFKGGGGHCYYRCDKGTVKSQIPDSKFKNGWTTLLWSCQPSKDDMHMWNYSATCPTNILDWK